MCYTTDVKDNSANKLILKAARRYNQDSADKHLVRDTRLDAFGEVAADVLGIAMTPAGFGLAIREALERHPHPYVFTVGLERAKALRSEWEANIVASVRKELGLD